MKNRDLSRITIPKNAWKPLKENKKSYPIAGLDTETSEGRAFIIGKSTIDHSAIARIRSFTDALLFLTNNELGGTHNFFHNLTYDYQAIFKLLPRRESFIIAETNELNHHGYKISIIPNKQLKITRPDDKTFKYYDSAQFYGYESLNSLGKKYFNSGKESLKHDITKLSPDRYDEDEEYKNDLDHYLKQDCTLTRKVGERLVEACRPLLKPKSWYSQAGLSQQYYLERAKRTLSLAPWAVMQASLNAYNGGRFETLRRGIIPKVKAYDIRSAYPYHAAKIPAIDQGEWVVNDKYDKEADLSILSVIAEGLSHIGLHRRERKGFLDYPTGKSHQWINKTEYETYKAYGYDVKVLKAYHFKAIQNPEMPFSFMHEVYTEKEKVGKDSPLYGVYKIIANGFYGKLIQMTPTYETKIDAQGWPKRIITGWKAGRLFNPIAAMEITANTRCQVAMSVIDDQESVVGFHTDSVFTTGKTNLKVSPSLGDWDDEGEKNLLMIGTGVYQFIDGKTKIRGFSKKGVLDTKNFSATSCDIDFSVMRNKHLRLGVRRDADYNDFNVLKDNIPRALDVNFDRKRIWERDFKSAREVLEIEQSSKPHIMQ